MTTTLRYSRFERVSLLRFFSRLKRNEVPPRTGANRNKQENPTYAERPRKQKDSTLAPHSPLAKASQTHPAQKPQTKPSRQPAAKEGIWTYRLQRFSRKTASPLARFTHCLRSRWSLCFQ